MGSPPATKNVASPEKGKERADEKVHLEPEGPARSLKEAGKHILVVGPKGSGKTAGIQLATNMEIQPENTGNTDTNNVRTYSTVIDGQALTFIDTPGFSELDTNNNDTAIQICQWLCDNIFAHEKDIHGILCLQDIGMLKSIRAMDCTAEFLHAIIGGNNARNTAFVTTKWDALNQSKLSQFDAKHDDWGRTALWRQMLNSGAILFRHYGISNTADDSEDDIRRAQQSIRDLLSHFNTSHPVSLQLREEFGGQRDRESTAKWLVNAMPSLHQFNQREANIRNNNTQGDLSQDQAPEGYSKKTKVAAGVGAAVAGAVGYYYRDDIKRGAKTVAKEVSRKHRNVERNTGMDWVFYPWITPDGIGIGGRGALR
ncbi:hypothetical protein P170DRAFT_430385 [Aspergillus steynii IBT 23096]|uniref:AIG1-type G domain-containing protein n=1 Tax=Aspergillus steynii IBT 23096 TaxID=1392250 RepID=A0A2I2FV54_9EURO|nr:uncharacterized protein P170DRAFT_430385 [Aspergillus steynii IBT 23096]PLB44502.1 hypothetical protein P170DRAFT_430385 [Aspergillus steynii IBT 23096]